MDSPWGLPVTHPWPLPSQIMPKASKQLFKTEYLLGLFIHFHLISLQKWSKINVSVREVLLTKAEFKMTENHSVTYMTQRLLNYGHFLNKRKATVFRACFKHLCTIQNGPLKVLPWGTMGDLIFFLCIF